MIGYVTLGTNDLEKAGAFFDALLSDLGATRLMEDGRLIIWGAAMDQPMLSVCKPYDENEASVGNGTMVALKMDSTDAIHAIYDKALELGGSDEGPPGPRTGSFYGGYFRDLDGNKFVAFTMVT
jgi:predicted lactoylglutathione lyase